MTALEIVKRLKKAGFIECPGTKHRAFRHPDGRFTLVARHKGDVPKGTLKSIERDTKIKMS